MFCPSCGTAITDALSYCNRCGANLNTKESPVESLLDGIFWLTAFSLGLIFGGVATLKATGVREAFIVAYMIISTLAFVGMYGLHVLQFFRLTRRDKDDRRAARDEKVKTRELEGAAPRTLPEPVESVTEGTTRSFEPVYRQQEKR